MSSPSAVALQTRLDPPAQEGPCCRKAIKRAGTQEAIGRLAPAQVLSPEGRLREASFAAELRRPTPTLTGAGGRASVPVGCFCVSHCQFLGDRSRPTSPSWQLL